jgi:hypothetical protein
LFVAVLVGDLDRVAKSFGGQKRRHGTFSLDQRIGRERCAVQHESDIAGADGGSTEHRIHGLDHPFLGCP